MTTLIRVLILCAAGYLIFLAGIALLQRKLLFQPTRHSDDGALSRGLSHWKLEGSRIGYAHEVAAPKAVWLFLHGNAGQAGDRVYALPSFSPHDSVYILEYPGYGSRPGSPSKDSINRAATQAYEALRARFPGVPVCIAGESIGSGPSAFLAMHPHPPDKIVLILPFDTLTNVAAAHFPFLPVRLLLRDNWDNIASLREYKGPLEIIGAEADNIIPIQHARALAAGKPSAVFHEIQGGHNDWADGAKVKIRYKTE